MKAIEEVMKNHVLRFLPAKSLYRFKSVSKSWNRWISSPFLAHQQSKHFTKTSGFFFSDDPHCPFFIPLHPLSHGVPAPVLSFLPVPATIRATSHGLLCCQSTSPDITYYVCNPATQQWTQLPDPMLFHSPDSSAVALHFTPSTYNFHSHFQIVCAVPSDSLKSVFFEIYSSRTNSWRVAESEYFYDHDQVLAFRGDGFCVDGFAYWETLNGVVLAFDLKYEEHGEIWLPPGHGQEGSLVEMDGELCYIMPHIKEAEIKGCYNLSVYGGLHMALKHEIPLDFGDYLRIDDDSDDGEVIIRVLCCASDIGVVVILVGGNNVVLYDVGEGKGSLVKRVGRAASGRCLPYVNSLVSVCPVEKMPAEDHHVLAEVLKSTSLI